MDAVLVRHPVRLFDALLVVTPVAALMQDAVFIHGPCAVLLLRAVLVVDATLVPDVLLLLGLVTRLVGC